MQTISQLAEVLLGSEGRFCCLKYSVSFDMLVSRTPWLRNQPVTKLLPVKSVHGTDTVSVTQICSCSILSGWSKSVKLVI